MMAKKSAALDVPASFNAEPGRHGRSPKTENSRTWMKNHLGKAKSLRAKPSVVADGDVPFAVPNWPVLTGEKWTLDRFKPYPDNPRTHPESQIDLLAAAIKKWGPDQPIVVDEEGVIIKGHGRLLAAHKAGLKDFPVVQHLGLSDDDKSAMRIADNQSSLLSSWHQGLLSLQLAHLQDVGFDMPLLGFGDDMLLSLIDPQAFSQLSGITLAQRFGVVPFTVFNAREGWWQERKRAWLALGMRPELGRGENLLKFSDSVKLDGKTYKGRQAAPHRKGRPHPPGGRLAKT